MDQYNISFAGAGRVGSALCKEFYKNGLLIDLIVSETESSGRMLADSCHSKWSSDLTFPDSTSLIIVAVPDHKLHGVLNKISCKTDTIVAHTAGSLGLDVFSENINKKAIFYPLQTFTKERQISFNKLPVFIESAEQKSSLILADLAKSIGATVYFADTEHRRMLHLAAVFVCNFTNHMLTEGKEISSKAGFPFEVLESLIKETFLKAIAIGPEYAQTGPAVRNDNITIEKHLKLLSFSPELRRTYEMVTKSIKRYYNKL
jgi:predicted short-subunit dehydrogenase-like oxidoreductase (DUF2520 family)